MIAQEFLSQCSDEQINKGVAWIECEKLSIHGRYSWTTRLLTNPLKYCANPDDIMPIAFANAISLETFDGSLWWADAPIIKDDLLEKTITSKELKNPLRAIAEVYILMSVNK